VLVGIDDAEKGALEPAEAGPHQRDPRRLHLVASLEQFVGEGTMTT
jgi:hypothetical protein